MEVGRWREEKKIGRMKLSCFYYLNSIKMKLKASKNLQKLWKYYTENKRELPKEIWFSLLPKGRRMNMIFDRSRQKRILQDMWSSFAE